MILILEQLIHLCIIAYCITSIKKKLFSIHFSLSVAYENKIVDWSCHCIFIFERNFLITGPGGKYKNIYGE